MVGEGQQSLTEWASELEALKRSPAGRVSKAARDVCRVRAEVTALACQGKQSCRRVHQLHDHRQKMKDKALKFWNTVREFQQMNFTLQFLLSKNCVVGRIRSKIDKHRCV